jgi:hypothetical protein
MNRSIQVVIIVLVLLAAVAVAGALARRERGADVTEMVLSRELQPGMSLPEATALLRRLKVPFWVDSTADGIATVTYGREVSQENHGSISSARHLVFDRRGRLRESFTKTQISSP